MAERDVLELAEWGEQNFGGGVVTNRVLRRREVLRAEARGLVKSLGRVPLCDDDGHIVMPERYREAWQLTEAGRIKLAEYRQESSGNA